jgi:hypothetical protein
MRQNHLFTDLISRPQFAYQSVNYSHTEDDICVTNSFSSMEMKSKEMGMISIIEMLKNTMEMASFIRNFCK